MTLSKRKVFLNASFLLVPKVMAACHDSPQEAILAIIKCCQVFVAPSIGLECDNS